MWKAVPAGIACDKKATGFGVCRPAAKGSRFAAKRRQQRVVEYHRPTGREHSKKKKINRLSKRERCRFKRRK